MRSLFFKLNSVAATAFTSSEALLQAGAEPQEPYLRNACVIIGGEDLSLSFLMSMDFCLWIFLPMDLCLWIFCCGFVCRFGYGFSVDEFRLSKRLHRKFEKKNLQ